MKRLLRTAAIMLFFVVGVNSVQAGWPPKWWKKAVDGVDKSLVELDKRRVQAGNDLAKDAKKAIRQLDKNLVELDKRRRQAAGDLSKDAKAMVKRLEVFLDEYGPDQGIQVGYDSDGNFSVGNGTDPYPSYPVGRDRGPRTHVETATKRPATKSKFDKDELGSVDTIFQIFDTEKDSRALLTVWGPIATGLTTNPALVLSTGIQSGDLNNIVSGSKMALEWRAIALYRAASVAQLQAVNLSRKKKHKRAAAWQRVSKNFSTQANALKKKAAGRKK